MRSPLGSMKALRAELDVPARIIVVQPPAGVVFALQRGKQNLGVTATSTGRDLQFEFTLQAARAPDGSPRFLGEFVQGPASGKFVYVNSGTLAGQVESPWTRRAKVGLQMVKWVTVEHAAWQGGGLLEARIPGVARDGGPACASVPLLDGGWVVKRSMGKINAGWHKSNRMPSRATLDQRVEWHLAHLRACGCRTDLPASIQAELKRRGLIPGERTPETGA